MQITVDFNDIDGWDDFHYAFFTRLGFPGYYDNSLEDWIKVMSQLVHGDSAPSHRALEDGEDLEIEMIGTETASHSIPDIVMAFYEAVAAVNLSYLDEGFNNRIKIIPG